MFRGEVEPHVAEKKDSKFGGWLSGAISRHMTGDPEPPSATPELDLKVVQRAAERYFLPAKVKRLEAKVEALEKKTKEAKKCLRVRKHCPLVDRVAYVKRQLPTRASDQAWIARRVDELMDREGKKLKDVCPKSWLKVANLPVGLAAALKHTILKSRAKTLISKAQ